MGQESTEYSLQSKRGIGQWGDLCTRQRAMGNSRKKTEGQAQKKKKKRRSIALHPSFSWFTLDPSLFVKISFIFSQHQHVKKDFIQSLSCIIKTYKI